MNNYTLTEIFFAMSLGLFFLGVLTFLTGVIILIRGSFGRDVKNLANQTAHLVHKGLAEDVAGLVGNASALLATTSEIVRTTAGVGVFLSVLGLIMMSISLGLMLYVYMG